MKGTTLYQPSLESLFYTRIGNARFGRRLCCVLGEIRNDVREVCLRKLKERDNA